MNTFILLGQVGIWQAVLIIVVIVLIFGGKKIPELMRGIGEGISEFKKATKEKDVEDEKNGIEKK